MQAYDACEAGLWHMWSKFMAYAKQFLMHVKKVYDACEASL